MINLEKEEKEGWSNLWISLASAGVNWLKSDMRVHITLSTNFWRYDVRFGPVHKTAYHLLKCFEQFLIYSISYFLDMHGRLVRDLQCVIIPVMYSVMRPKIYRRVRKHNRGRSIAFPSHSIDQPFLLFARFFVDGG
jgi:hypothetical protein